MSGEKTKDIIVIAQKPNGEIMFYLNDKQNLLVSTIEEMKERADYLGADVNWLIIPNTNPPKNDSPL